MREFLDLAFKCVGLKYEEYLEIDENLFRPSEVMLLRGDASKAKKKLGWVYEGSFENLVQEMVESDLEYFQKMA